MNRRMPTTVLLLDGRDDYRTAFAEALRGAGLQVRECADTQTAVDAINTSPPRVIVAGFDPRTREDRLSFCRTIKADPRTSGISVLLTTPSMADDDAALATDPGVLVLTVRQDDGAKLIAALEGVLVAQRAAPIRASLRKRRTANRLA